MFTPNPRQKPPGTYVMQGVTGNGDLNRLQLQDQMITTSMGGVLSEQSNPAGYRSVLDVGCGPGGWLLMLASAYPGIPKLVGVDINPKMVNFARARASALGVDDRVEFQQMDALVHLDFPDETFDLVNERFGVSWLRSWDWPPFLKECQRVTRPGGLIRLTEFDIVTETSSSAMRRLGELTLKAFYQAGNFFSLERDGITKQLVPLLRQHGLLNVQTRTHMPEYRAGTQAGELIAEDWKHAYRGILPFLQKWIQVPDNYEEIYQQMLSEMQDPSFVAIWSLLTAWGTRSSNFLPPKET